jgi:hypothetical protein
MGMDAARSSFKGVCYFDMEDRWAVRAGGA